MRRLFRYDILWYDPYSSIQYLLTDVKEEEENEV